MPASEFRQSLSQSWTRLFLNRPAGMLLSSWASCLLNSHWAPCDVYPVYFVSPFTPVFCVALHCDFYTPVHPVTLVVCGSSDPCTPVVPVISAFLCILWPLYPMLPVTFAPQCFQRPLHHCVSCNHCTLCLQWPLHPSAFRWFNVSTKLVLSRVSQGPQPGSCPVTKSIITVPSISLVPKC